MKRSEKSWQGIGISSNPFQRRDPTSLHLLAHLRETSQVLDQNLIIIADSMQIPNYMAMHDLSERQARKVAKRKGMEKKRNLQRILKSEGIENVSVKMVDEVIGEEERFTIGQLRNLYQTDGEVRKKFLSIVPQRLKEKASDLDAVADYAITEVGLILSLPGVKFGHEREKGYDGVADFIHEMHGIGQKPNFRYSRLGLEFVPDTGARVEPYSSYGSQGRLLLTDSKSDFFAKIDGLSKRSRRRVDDQLQAAFGKDTSDPSFYDSFVKHTHDSLRRPIKIIRNVGLATAASLALLVGGTAGVIHNDAHNIRQKHFEEISIFGLNGDLETCNSAARAAMENANEEIREKYGISGYFNFEPLVNS